MLFYPHRTQVNKPINAMEMKMKIVPYHAKLLLYLMKKRVETKKSVHSNMGNINIKINYDPGIRVCFDIFK